MFQAAVALLSVYTLSSFAVFGILLFVIYFSSTLPAAVPDAAVICLLSSLSIQQLLYRFSTAIHAKQAWMKIDLIILSGPPATGALSFFLARDSKYEFRNFLRAYHYLFRVCLFRKLISSRDIFVGNILQTTAVPNPAVNLLNSTSLGFGHIKLSLA